MAGAPKTTRKRTGKAIGGKSAPRRKAGPAPAKTTAGNTKPARSKAKTKKPPPAPGRRSLPQLLIIDAWGTATLAQQRRAGYALILISAAGIAGIGAWVTADSLHGVGHWAIRAAIRGICLGLIGLSLWIVLSQRQAVSRALVFGVSAATLLVYETGSAWWVDRARDLADRTLLRLESGEREVDSLTPLEMADPYIEAYVVMRDIYWELYVRSDDEMSRYRSYYEDYTGGGAFLDVERLATTTDLRRSIVQIEDLQHRLLRVEASHPDISDLLLTVDLLDVDAATRAAYAGDVHAARDAFVEETLASVARERETLRAMRRALKALVDAEGRYRIEDGRIIFEHPEDAARFTGKAEAG